MAAPANIKSGVGFRHCQIFTLTTSGLLAAVDDTAYEGLQISGARGLTLPIPEPQQINHYGDDRIFAVDRLPPNESISGTLTVGKNNFDVDALITGQNVVTIGETKFFGRATDKQGSEAQVCMIAWRQTLDTTPGASRVRRWDVRLMPVCQIIPMNPSFDASNPEEMTYTVRPQVVSAYPWGIPFAEGVEGYTEGQLIDATTEYKPKLIAFLGDAAAVAFSLPAAAPAVSTAKMQVWHTVAATGVTADVTGTVILAVDSVTFALAPAAGDTITVWYEYA